MTISKKINTIAARLAATEVNPLAHLIDVYDALVADKPMSMATFLYTVGCLVESGKVKVAKADLPWQAKEILNITVRGRTNPYGYIRVAG